MRQRSRYSLPTGYAFLVFLAPVMLACCGDNLPTAQEKLRTAPSPLVRAQAAERLGSIGCDEAVRTLTLHGLRDTSPMVRAAATKALAESKHPQVIDLLGELLLDPDMEVRRQAAEALTSNRGEKARRYLELGYFRSSSGGRTVLSESLVAAGSSPRGIVEEIANKRLQRRLVALESGNQAERIGALGDLGHSGRPEALAAVATYLGHPSVPIAAAAARALGEAGEKSAVQDLVGNLSETQPALRRAALYALGAIGDPSAAKDVAKLAKGESKSLAMQAIETLSELDDSKEVDDRLCGIAVSASRSTLAVDAARRLRARTPDHDCDLAGRVRQGLSGEGDKLRAALRLLLEIEDLDLEDQELDTLGGLLSHDDLEIRTLAVDAAAHVALEEAAAHVAEAFLEFREADRRAREIWITGLLPARLGWGDDGTDDSGYGDHMERGGPAGSARYRARYDELMERLAGYRADLDARRQALMGLEKEDVDEARGSHLEALFSDAPGVRARLFAETSPATTRYLSSLTRAVVRLNGPKVLEDVAMLLEHPEKQVRVAAVESIAEIDIPDATKLLLSAVKKDQYDEVLVAVSRALVERSGDHSGALLPIFDWAGADAQRSLALILARKGSEEAVDSIAGLLDGPAGLQAAMALSIMGSDKATNALVKHLRTIDAQGMEKLPDLLPKGVAEDAGLEIARQGLHSEWPQVRAAAARYLRRAGVTDPWLEALRGDYYASVRRAAE